MTTAARSFLDIDLSTVDLTDLTYFQDGPPHELFARMRTEASPHWNAVSGDEPGFWSFTRASDIKSISLDTELFSSARGGVFTTLNAVAPIEAFREIILGMDPPRHTQQRKVVQGVFTPRLIRQREDAIRLTVTDLIDDVIERGSCDFVEDIAVELPLRVTTDMLGVPQSDRRQLFDWTNTLSHAAAISDPQMGLGALMEISAYLAAHTAARKANPTDDLASRLVTAEVDGESLTDTEVWSFFALLMFGGNDTTRNTASGGMRALIDHDDQRQKLRADPALIPGAVEEMLRWVTAVNYFTRTVQRDTTVGGQQLKEVERVAMWYAAAARDPDLNPDPDTFDVTRAKPMHQAFGGGGAHFCIGAALSRLEIRVLFEELIRRVPDMQLAGPTSRLVSNWTNELTSMPVTFTPGRREGAAR